MIDNILNDRAGEALTVTVTDTTTGKELIKSTTKIDLDPLVTYVGVGYRF